MLHPIRRIHAIQILRHLGTQKPARNRMLRIALNLRGPPVLDGDQHPASIRTVVRTSGMDDLLHRFDYTVLARSIRTVVRTSGMDDLLHRFDYTVLASLAERSRAHDEFWTKIETDGPQAVRHGRIRTA